MKIDSKGIYVEDDRQEMDESVFTDLVQDDLYQLEDKSWWFVLRAKLIVSLAKGKFNKKCYTVDVGGGNGYTTKVMKENGYKMALMEPSYEACLHAKERGIEKVMCSTIGQRENVWKQCMLLDVLEHIEDDEAFLQNLRKEMQQGGGLILTVPAMKILWSSEDDEAGHFRRYSCKELRKVLTKAGFEVGYISYFFSYLFVPVLLIRVGMEKIGLLKPNQDRSYEEKREVAEKQFLQKSGIVTMVLNLLNQMEIRWIKNCRQIPIGSSLICYCKKL